MSIVDSGVSLDMATSGEAISETNPIVPADSKSYNTLYDPKAIVFPPNDKPKEMNKDQIKEIQEYLKNPDNDLKTLLQEKYDGEVNGLVSDDLKSIARSLEKSIYKVIDEDVDGMILNTTLDDIKAAVNKVAAYKRYLNKNDKVAKMTLDDRFIKLSKILYKK